MKRIFLVFLVFTFLTSADIEVSDVTYKSRLFFKNEQYVLNGAGVRGKFFFDLYTIGLYLKEESTDGNLILNSISKKLIKITVVSSLITADRFSNGMDDGFEKSTNGNTDSIAKEIAELKKGFGKDFNVGDKFTLFFDSDGSTTIFKETKLQVKIPSSYAFQKALLGMWIGEDPVVGDLKEELLGVDK